MKIQRKPVFKCCLCTISSKKTAHEITSTLMENGIRPHKQTFKGVVHFKFLNRQTTAWTTDEGVLAVQIELPFNEFPQMKRVFMEKIGDDVVVDLSVDEYDNVVCMATVPFRTDLKTVLLDILSSCMRRCVYVYEESALKPFNEKCKITAQMLVKSFFLNKDTAIDIKRDDCVNPFDKDLAISFSAYLDNCFGIHILPENFVNEGRPTLKQVIKILQVYVTSETPYQLARLQLMGKE